MDWGVPPPSYFANPPALIHFFFKLFSDPRRLTAIFPDSCLPPLPIRDVERGSFFPSPGLFSEVNGVSVLVPAEP